MTPQLQCDFTIADAHSQPTHIRVRIENPYKSVHDLTAYPPQDFIFGIRLTTALYRHTIFTACYHHTPGKGVSCAVTVIILYQRAYRSGVRQPQLWRHHTRQSVNSFYLSAGYFCAQSIIRTE